MFWRRAQTTVYDATKQAYKTAVRARKDWLAEFKGLPVCAAMMRTWRQTARAMIEVEGEGNGTEPKPQLTPSRKKRKIMKGFKKWTGTANEGEWKFKGWSDNGHKAFVQHTMNIKSDVASGQCALWEKAFREVSTMQQEARMSEEEPAAMKYTVNRSVVWEL